MIFSIFHISIGHRLEFVKSLNLICLGSLEDESENAPLHSIELRSEAIFHSAPALRACC